VDAFVLGQQNPRQKRNELTLPPGLELANVTTLSNRKIFDEEGEYGEFRYFAQESNPGRTWKDLKWVE
jgi:4-hydroxymandelate oxidase